MASSGPSGITSRMNALTQSSTSSRSSSPAARIPPATRGGATTSVASKIRCDMASRAPSPVSAPHAEMKAPIAEAGPLTPGRSANTAWASSASATYPAVSSHSARTRLWGGVRSAAVTMRPPSSTTAKYGSSSP